VDIFGAAETNIDWNAQSRQIVRHHCQRFFKNTLLATSSSTNHGSSDFQPGGTLTTVNGKWTGRSTAQISDSSGMGRWSGYSLQKSDSTAVHIITAYRPVKSTESDSHTFFQQNWNIMRNQGNQKPDPSKQFFHDLGKLITALHQQRDDVIVMLDANEAISDNKQLLTFLASHHLASLVTPIADAPATYNRGSKCIDFILGSQHLLPMVQSSGYLPFYEGGWPTSDHRAVFVDLDHITLFGASTSTIIPPVPRLLTSKCRKSVQQFIQHLAESHTLYSLLARLIELEKINSWTTDDHDELEQIDVLFTKSLLAAEAKAAKPTSAWSPRIHHAYLIYTYWCIKRSSVRNNRDATSQLASIESQLPPAAVFQGNPQRSCRGQKRIARRTLTNIRIHARKHRDEFLQIHQESISETGSATRAKAIQQVRNQEHKQQGWNTVRMLSTSGATGGISYILVPVVDSTGKEIGRTRIQGKEALDPALYSRNRTHFSQADGTPFTRPPLSQDLGFHGCTVTSEAILEGTVPQTYEQFTRALLGELKRCRQPISPVIDFAEMCYGFGKWREKTTTSPSTKHLGIYKSLINAVTYHIAPDDTKDTTLSDTKNVAHVALQIQHKLLNLAIASCHSFRRWHTVHNFFLEKIPGKPLVEKLRVIHIYEADWNFLNRYFAAYKITKLATRELTVTSEQGGGRPGRSSAEIAVNTVITYEIIRLQRQTGAFVYHDAKACYDRIVENLANMCLMR
jgi:hypothetical protein